MQSPKGIGSQSLMQAGSEGDEESVAQSYSNVVREAWIYHHGIFLNLHRGIHYPFETPDMSVSFSALRKDVVNILDFMERLKNEKGQNAVGMADEIEELKSMLAFICTYGQLSRCDLEEFDDEMGDDSRKEVENLLQQILDDVDNNVRCKYNMDHVLPSLMDNIEECTTSCHHSTSSAMMTDEQLNFLLLNLHFLSMYLAEQVFPLVTQYEILQKVCGNIRDFHGLILNGYVEREIVEYVLPQLQHMAEKVGIFLWDDLTKKTLKSSSYLIYS
ncbi:hypothetical protein BC332_14603 [Capsicum chinense]|nr:hypothetical protein BC332_14603 [Capsicum chinense]